MSNQALKNETANVNLLAAERRSATRSYKLDLEIFEENGYAAIKWILDPRYAIGSEDKIYVREDTKMTHEMRVVGHSATWKTPHVWGSGLSAAYMAWNYEDKHAGLLELVATPNT